MEVIYRGGTDAGDYFPLYRDKSAKHSYEAHIREKTARALPMLEAGLDAADAEYSGRLKSCVLETYDGIYYGGHTTEPAPVSMVSAEEMALSQVPPEEKITMVYLAGRDIKKPKHIMPSHPVFDRLEPMLDEYAPIVAVGPNSADTVTVISPQLYRELYEPKPLSVLSGNKFEITRALRRNTILELEDYTLFEQLHYEGKATGIEYYLLGSAGARGSASNIFTRGWEYSDLDIAAITELDTLAAQEHFEECAEIWYKDLEKSPHNVRIWPSGEIREGITYTGTCYERGSTISIDFFVARSLAQALVRPENLSRNFYHKIS